MPRLIEAPVRVEAAGTPPKLIDECVGRVAVDEERVSIAHMRSPHGRLCLPALSPETVYGDED